MKEISKVYNFRENKIYKLKQKYGTKHTTKQ